MAARPEATAYKCQAALEVMSNAGWIDGGHVPMPGDVSLVPHGVLCLDERPEFRRPVLEVLRQPLENGIIQIPSPARLRCRCAGGAGRVRQDHYWGESPVAPLAPRQ